MSVCGRAEPSIGDRSTQLYCIRGIGGGIREVGNNDVVCSKRLLEEIENAWWDVFAEFPLTILRR